MSDKLDILFKRQRDLQHKLGYDFASMTDREASAYIKEYAQHADHELHEMLAELPFFKSWKRYDEEDNDYRPARKEFIDAFHFMINIALGLDMTSCDLFDEYMNKQEENLMRQEDTRHYKKCVEVEE